MTCKDCQERRERLLKTLEKARESYRTVINKYRKPKQFASKSDQRINQAEQSAISSNSDLVDGVDGGEQTSTRTTKAKSE